MPSYVFWRWSVPRTSYQFSHCIVIFKLNYSIVVIYSYCPHIEKLVMVWTKTEHVLFNIWAIERFTERFYMSCFSVGAIWTI